MPDMRPKQPVTPKREPEHMTGTAPVQGWKGCSAPQVVPRQPPQRPVDDYQYDWQNPYA